MLEGLLICTCEESDCGYEFITNSTENLHCPSCRSENIAGTWKKAIILHELDEKDIDNSNYLRSKVNEWVSDIKENIEAYCSLREWISGWFDENGYSKPDIVNFEIKRHYDYSDEGDDYFAGISFEGDNLVDTEKLEKLRHDLFGNYPVDTFKAIESIRL